MEETVAKKKLSPKLILAVLAAILVCVIALVGIHPEKKAEPQIDVISTLDKIVKTSDLSTAVFQYQGIAAVANPKNVKKTDYYICYTASVYAGIDFSQIHFTENKTAKTITATLPEVKILDTIVDPDSLDFMFQSKKADDISVVDVALTACETDIQQECTSENAILEVARLNTENTVRALAEPVIESIYKDYTFVIEDAQSTSSASQSAEEGSAENEV